MGMENESSAFSRQLSAKITRVKLHYLITNHPRKAFKIFWRAACQAGAMPPNKPMIMPKIIAETTTMGVILKLNTTSLKVT
jgi:hypothetical protein